mmetsp:Transcript_10754/g.19488  ORF Transcript_10754/g.19488 Transcript_10754/m.19488 type:complete len:83 (-) Transcript_10754:123-371(-)
MAKTIPKWHNIAIRVVLSKKLETLAVYAQKSQKIVGQRQQSSSLSYQLLSILHKFVIYTQERQYPLVDHQQQHALGRWRDRC